MAEREQSHCAACHHRSRSDAEATAKIAGSEAQLIPAQAGCAADSEKHPRYRQISGHIPPLVEQEVLHEIVGDEDPEDDLDVP